MDRQSSPACSGRDDAAGHDRECHLDRGDQLNQVQGWKARSRDAPDPERQPVVFRYESACRHRQALGPDPFGGWTYTNVHDLTPVAELMHGDQKVVDGDAGYKDFAKRPEMAGKIKEVRVAIRPGKRRGPTGYTRRKAARSDRDS